MRVSTGMIFDAGSSAINRQAADLLRIQQQLATGRRMITPADDPVAASAALETTQAVDMTSQFGKTQEGAASSLGLLDTHLQSVSDLLIHVRTLAVSAGNASLTDIDRRTIATQLRASFDELLSTSNAKDASGDYLFSGYMGNTRPFSGSVETGVSYAGDDGQRQMQVSPSQQVAVSESGNQVFNRIREGNGVFVTSPEPSNTGTGIADLGSVTDPAKWYDIDNSGDLEVRFWIDTAGSIGPVNATYYDLVDATTSTSLLTNTASTAGGMGNTYTQPYTSGQTISFSGMAAPFNDFGASLSITGTPASGDRFNVNSSASQSVFDTLGRFIMKLEQPVAGNASARAQMSSEIGQAINGFDQSLQNILTVRASGGAHMAQLEALQSTNSSLKLQYQEVLSRLQDVDYTQAITELTRTQTQLQAAQQSFVKSSQLSLFNYI